MTVRNGFRIIAGVLLFVLLVGAAAVAAWMAYNAGVAQGAAGSEVQLPATPFYFAPYAFHPYGLGLLGCFVPLVFIFLGCAFVRMIFWGGMGEHRHWRRFGPEARHGHWREMAEEWHRREHAAEKEGPSQGDSPAA